MNNIIKWKAEYGSIYKTTMEGEDIYYRALTPLEIHSYTELEGKTKEDLELLTCLIGTLSDNFSKLKRPGSISGLSADIWEKSTPTTVELKKSAQKAREWAIASKRENYAVSLACLISEVHPAADITSLLRTPLPQLLRIGALVEQIFGIAFIGGEGGKKIKSIRIPNNKRAPMDESELDYGEGALDDVLSMLKNNKKK